MDFNEGSRITSKYAKTTISTCSITFSLDYQFLIIYISTPQETLCLTCALDCTLSRFVFHSQISAKAQYIMRKIYIWNREEQKLVDEIY